jgi:hypothetical protein
LALIPAIQNTTTCVKRNRPFSRGLAPLRYMLIRCLSSLNWNLICGPMSRRLLSWSSRCRPARPKGKSCISLKLGILGRITRRAELRGIIIARDRLTLGLQSNRKYRMKFLELICRYRFLEIFCRI